MLRNSTISTEGLPLLVHPQFDPVVFSLGPIAVRWYGLMYVVAFIAFITLGKLRVRQGLARDITAKDVDDMLIYGVLGVILGGRLGYVLFYKPGYYLEHPGEILQIWSGGMSFHGGFLGVLLGVALFCWIRKKRWITTMDFIAPLVPLGLAAGRLGNFINGELPGRPTTLPWGMWFPQHDREAIARHPSQLYQFALEGIVLFIVLWLYSSKPRPAGAVSGAFLAGYGFFRFLAEFGRQPDEHLGLLAMSLSMGQWLSLPMILAGVALMAWASRKSGSDTALR
jgi:phosphatidylglycerol:prolipoprotein diacylglycerol transferase